MAEMAGERLLTTWLSGDRFWSMLRDGCGADVINAISVSVNEWRSLGLDEVYFDFHVRGSSAVARLKITENESENAPDGTRQLESRSNQCEAALSLVQSRSEVA